MNNRTPFILCLGAIFSLAPFGIDMYLPALPSIAEGLSTDIDAIEASVAIFLLGYAVSQLIWGPLSDSFGRMPVLFTGLALFVVGSFLCGFAATENQLYAFRFVQAIGGGASVVVYALIRDRFDAMTSAQVISYVMAVVVVAPLIAPIIGGEILVRFGWQWIFYGLGIYALLTLITTQYLVSGTLVSKNLIRENNSQVKRPRQTLSNGLQQIFTAYHSVLTNMSAMAHILTGAFAFAGMFAFVAGSPFVYIQHFGVAADHYGYLVGANAAVMFSANILNAKTFYRINPTIKTLVGACIIGVAGVGLLTFNSLGFGLWWIVGGVMLYVGVLGLISANAIAGALACFTEASGTVSAVSGVFMFGLGAISSAVISWLDSTDATAMTSVMAACGVLALLSAFPLWGFQPKQSVIEQ